MSNRDMSEYRIRRGPGIAWADLTSRSYSTGFTIDNLDKKTANEAINDYERVFISIRDCLSKNEAKCLDNEGERLDVCQKITDALRAAFKFSSREGQ